MIIDLHCDTIQRAYDEGLKLNDKKLCFNTKETKLPHIQCLSTFVHSKYSKENEGFQRANQIIDNFYKTYNQNEIFIIKNKNDFESPELKQKIGAILTIENGTAISGNLQNIEKLYNKGIRMMGIVWNDDNDLACGAHTINDTGLTELGKQYVKELQKQKIIIDVSHASKKTFYDVLKNTEVPIIASHSCVQKICNHPRNLDDDQIKQIAKRNGVIGICFCKSFLTNNETVSVKNIIEHIDYIANLVGIDHIAFGSDFDGLEPEHILPDLAGVGDFGKIIDGLKNIGYSELDIRKISCGNFIRVFQKTNKNS